MIVVRCTDADRRALAGIDIDPAEMIDDGTNYSGLKITKPWGYEEEVYRDQNSSTWRLHIDAHKETSLHCHPNKTTTLIILAGLATLSTLNGKHEMGGGSVVMIESGAFHRTSSNGGPVVLYEIEFPANKRDLVRLNDSYGRCQGYERV